MPTYPCFICFWQATQLLDSVVRGPVLIETMLWGLFSCLLILSTFLWIQDSPHSIVRVYMISVCVTMYAAATAHWVVMFDWLQKTSSLQEEFLLNSVQHSAIATLCQTPQEFNPDSPLFFNLPVLPSCGPTAFLSVNVILSDALVLYRAGVIWPRNIVVQLVNSLLFLWLLGLSAITVFVSCGTEKSTDCNFCNSNGVPVIGVSFILNLWATFLIGYKAWEHKQVIKTYLTKGNTRTRSEKVLGLLIDTGLLYSALWVVVLAGTFSNSPGEPSVAYLQNSGLVQLVGMYPTILVSMVTFERLQKGGTSAVQSIRTLTQNVHSVHLRSAMQFAQENSRDAYTPVQDTLSEECTS